MSSRRQRSKATLRARAQSTLANLTEPQQRVLLKLYDHWCIGHKEFTPTSDAGHGITVSWLVDHALVQRRGDQVSLTPLGREAARQLRKTGVYSPLDVFLEYLTSLAGGGQTQEQS